MFRTYSEEDLRYLLIYSYSVRYFVIVFLMTVTNMFRTYSEEDLRYTGYYSYIATLLDTL